MLCDKNIKRKNDRFLYGKRNKEFVILKAKKTALAGKTPHIISTAFAGEKED